LYFWTEPKSRRASLFVTSATDFRAAGNCSCQKKNHVSILVIPTWLWWGRHLCKTWKTWLASMQFALPIMLENISYHKSGQIIKHVNSIRFFSFFGTSLTLTFWIRASFHCCERPMNVASRLNTMSIAAKTKHYKDQLLLADSPAGHVLA